MTLNPLTLYRRWQRRRELAKAPQTLNDAVQWFIDHCEPDVLATFKTQSRADCICGFGFMHGMSVRNSWGLWEKGQPLSRELEAAGIWMADDSSAVIFTALWCRLNGQPFRIEDEVARYDAHWARAGLGRGGVPLKENV